MLELSIAFVIFAGISGWLVNKYLDMKYALNTEATNVAAVAALEDRINKFDQRINDTWSTISSTKQELEAHKLAMGLRGQANVNR